LLWFRALELVTEGKERKLEYCTWSGISVGRPIAAAVVVDQFPMLGQIVMSGVHMIPVDGSV
jgi:hypothetical protein